VARVKKFRNKPVAGTSERSTRPLYTESGKAVRVSSCVKLVFVVKMSRDQRDQWARALTLPFSEMKPDTAQGKSWELVGLHVKCDEVVGGQGTFTVTSTHDVMRFLASLECVLSVGVAENVRIGHTASGSGPEKMGRKYSERDVSYMVAERVMKLPSGTHTGNVGDKTPTGLVQDDKPVPAPNLTAQPGPKYVRSTFKFANG
jgi:hypothetical protein